MVNVSAVEFASILDSIGEAIIAYDEDLRVIYCNPSAADLVGLSKEEAIGRHCYQVLRGEYCETDNCPAVKVQREGKAVVETVSLVVGKGESIPVKIVATPLRNAEGQTVGMIEIVTDLSHLQLVRERDELIRKLSTPLVEVAEGITLLPLVGILDSDRTKQLTESILEHIASRKVNFVIMDISGIAAIDTATAGYLVRTHEAVRLMGSGIVVTGIRPDVAVTLVALGVDLSSSVTRSSLREGLEYAYHELGLKLTRE